MKIFGKCLLTAALLLSPTVAVAVVYGDVAMPYNQGINIIPKPKTLVVQQGFGAFVIDDKPAIYSVGKEAGVVADFFVSKVNKSFAQALGSPLTVESLPAFTETRANKHVLFVVDTSLKLGDEGYTLRVNGNSIVVKGKTARGLFWGMQSLLQLLPAEVESQRAVAPGLFGSVSIPALYIEDEPAFPYRGMHLDPSRHFATAEEVKRHIDILSMFKINKLHWHLTDDQGWRIEIKKYPRLTELGSKRTPSKGAVTDGYYTQAEIKDIVAYAEARHVEIIPEIEMPGHAMGAIVAYPELACNPTTQKGSPYQMRDIWGVEIDVFCAGNERVFDFLQDVIDEVAPLFPSQYFHIGGDECPKTRWEKCPKCQARIKSEGLKDEHELQSYVIRRAVTMLAKHNKKLIGWDEILEGGLAPSATVMSWRGEEGGIKSANMGHDVIMTPGSGGLYIDFYQGDPKIEPVGICCYSPLSKVYDYYPIPESIAADKRHHILGAQVNVWSEYLYTDSLRQYRAYPRTIALAEAVWTPRTSRDFVDFTRRLDNAYVRLDQYGINYHIPQPEQPHGSLGYVAFTDTTSLVLKTSRPIKVVYTLDGSTPTMNSPEYKEPIKISRNCVVKTASVLPSGKTSPVRNIVFEKQKYVKAKQLRNVKEGLRVKVSVGEYESAKDFAKATNWTSGVVEKIARIIPDKLVNNFDELERKAVVAEGYIKVPEDGVYVFSTNYDEFWIAGKKLIDNAGEVKKFSRKDKSIALKAGYHPVKIVFVGATHGGFPSYWAENQVEMRNLKSAKWENAVGYYVD